MNKFDAEPFPFEALRVISLSFYMTSHYAVLHAELVTVYSNLIDLYKPIRLDMDIEGTLPADTVALVSHPLEPNTTNMKVQSHSHYSRLPAGQDDASVSHYPDNVSQRRHRAHLAHIAGRPGGYRQGCG